MLRCKKWILLFFVCGLFSWLQPASAGQPLAKGVFWQLNGARLELWSDEQLAREVALLKRAGLEVLIIQYGASWNNTAGQYQTYIPNAEFPLIPQAVNRDPLAAVFKAARQHRVKVVLGDFLIPQSLRYKDLPQALEAWLSEKANRFRRELIEKYKDDPSFYGYYIPNEPNPYYVENRKAEWVEATRKVAALVKEAKPDLTLMHSIGLYAQWKKEGDGTLRPYAPSVEYLDAFWRDWFKGIPQIDVWMIIDGIGTSMASLQSTDTAQAWGAQLSREHGKAFWVDVENAVMGNKGHYPFPFSRLKASLDVAAKHTDHIVLFEYLGYMSPNSNKIEAQNLYLDYLQYHARLSPDGDKHDVAAK